MMPHTSSEVVEVVGLDQVEPGQLLGHLGVRPVGDDRAVVARADHPRLAGVGELGAPDDLVAALPERAREALVLGVHRGAVLGRRGLPGGLVAGQEDDVRGGHGRSLRLGPRGATSPR